LLKGDVLAYIGKIEGSYASDQEARIRKLGHLDLSNIKIAQAKEKPAPAKPAATPEPLSIEEPDLEVAVPISFKAVVECQKRVQESIGVFLPLSNFIARATELANENLPRSKTAQPSADELFDAVLGLDKVAGRKYTRGHFVPRLNTLSQPSPRTTKPVHGKSDILDILAGKKAAPRAPKVSYAKPAAGAASPTNVLSVNVSKGDEKRAEVFLERVKSVLESEPGRLVV
jgi:hypothetical protein